MVTVPTVLVLGAGASAHLGYPVGSELKDEICRYLSGPEGNLHPRIATAFTREVRRGLLMRLSNSAFGSIDAFLAANSDCMELGKLLIVDRLKRQENLTRLLWPGDPGWYGVLLGAMLTDDPTALPGNRLTVITFNYDRSLEVFLEQRIHYHYNIEEAEAGDIMRRLSIIHPHGVMGPYPETPYRTDIGDDLATRAAAIKVISELDDADEGFCSPEFEAAHLAIAEAQRVYFLGFGFHTDNMRRLRLLDLAWPGRRDVLSTYQQMYTMERQALLNGLSEYRMDHACIPREANCDLFFREVARLD
jgi:hypothetical protein